jgi:hypothetical protein
MLSDSGGGMSVVFFLLGVLVVAALLFVVIIVSRRGPKGLNKEQYQSDWLALEQSVTAEPATWQLVVLNADKLLDRALKERGYKGTTMGERMMSAARTFTKRNHVWAAHKLRNRLAHEDNVPISLKVTKQALTGFKSGLKDLGAL